jgi:hypothetical protein
MEQSANHLTLTFGYSVKLNVIQNEHLHLHTILQKFVYSHSPPDIFGQPHPFYWK